MVSSYVVINGFCMGLTIKNKSDLMIRTGTLASINMIPLFFGGRTNMIANLLGISLHSYYLAHNWIGTVVAIQGLLHVILVMILKRSWTFHSSQISGISATSALALMLLSSYYFARKLMFELFLKLHLFLALVVAVALLIHLLSIPTSSSMFPILCLSVWAFNSVLRLLRIAYYNTGYDRSQKAAQATITHYFDGQVEGSVSALRVTVRLPRAQNLLPGQYFYAFLSDLGISRRIQAHPYVVAWWDSLIEAKSLSFLIEPQDGVSAELVGRNSLKRVILDGPYGKDLQLESFETVILIAKGIGIAGILPYIRHMTNRRVLPNEQWAYQYRCGLITRKIDVYWILEENSQQKWVADWIRDLYNLDKKNLFLTFTCFYPRAKTDETPVPSEDHWRFIYRKQPLPIIEDLMVKQIQRSSGNTKVTVCGSRKFSRSVRKRVLHIMSNYKNVEFAETEFRPQGVRQGYPGIRKLGGDDIELGTIKSEEGSMRLSRSSRDLSITEQPHVAKKTQLADDKRRLIKRHSGIANELTTVMEEDEDQTDLSIGDQGGSIAKKEVKEFL